MNFTSAFSSIDLILGPMFAGKTSELLRQLNIYQAMGLRCIYINSDKDIRSDENFSTHNACIQHIGKIDSIKLPTDITSIIELQSQYDVFGIDEAQLFSNLLSSCTQLVEQYQKKLIIAALNCDSERRPFGDIIYFITFCDNIHKLNPFCQLCAKTRKLTPAIFTKCLCEKRSAVLIGAKETYIPVCRQCYIESSTTQLPALPPNPLISDSDSSCSDSSCSDSSSAYGSPSEKRPILTDSI